MLRATSPNFRIRLLDIVLVILIIAMNAVPESTRFSFPRHFLQIRLRVGSILLGILFSLLWNYCFQTLRLYSRVATIQSRAIATMKGAAIMTFVIVTYLRIAHSLEVSFGEGLAILFSFFAFEISRVFLREYLVDDFVARDPRRAIILGSGRRASKAWREIRTRYDASIKLLGFVDDRPAAEMAPEVAQLHMGKVGDLNEILLTQVVDLILIAMPIQSCYPVMQRVIDIAESSGVEVIYLGDIYSSSRSLRLSNETLFIELEPTQNAYVNRLIIKRLMDIVCAGFALIVLAPFLFVIACSIKLTSPGPVLFRHQRYGQRRRLFKMLKFRSMVGNAEALQENLEPMNEADGPEVGS